MFVVAAASKYKDWSVLRASSPRVGLERLSKIRDDAEALPTVTNVQFFVSPRASENVGDRMRQA